VKIRGRVDREERASFLVCRGYPVRIGEVSLPLIDSTGSTTSNGEGVLRIGVG